MADNAHRFVTLPISLIMRDSVGFTFQAWQPPLEGWQSLTELHRAATADELGGLQRQFIVANGGMLGLILDPPGWDHPIKGRRRG